MAEAGLKQKFSDDMKAAMKSGETLKRDTLRMLNAAVKNAEIEKRGDLEESEIIGLVAREIKRRQESIDAFTLGNRRDLVDKEAAEKKILQAYMPPQMSRDEITAIVKEVMAAVGASAPADKGKVMKELMPRVKGKAEGKLVNEIVTELLSQ
ncbi:MAG: GatB/YqeY domain-containing protein [Dehalococcoidales bacterium]|nr:GatB/YqeY domain-containing protein [Dehalococcoidales bacterium]